MTKMAFEAAGTCYCYVAGGGLVRCDNHLTTAEQKLRLFDPRGMYDGTILTIKFNSGFEAFSRGIPYHNYEDWGSGFVIESNRIKDPHPKMPDRMLFSSHEYLDAAIDQLIARHIQLMTDEKEKEGFQDRVDAIERHAIDWRRRGNGKSSGY